MIALLHVQSSTRIFFHNAILFIDTSNNAKYQPPLSLIRALYLAIISSNVNKGNKSKEVVGRNTNFVLLVILEKTRLATQIICSLPFPANFQIHYENTIKQYTTRLELFKYVCKSLRRFSYSVDDPSSDFSIFPFWWAFLRRFRKSFLSCRQKI